MYKWFAYNMYHIQFGLCEEVLKREALPSLYTLLPPCEPLQRFRERRDGSFFPISSLSLLPRSSSSVFSPRFCFIFLCNSFPIWLKKYRLCERLSQVWSLRMFVWWFRKWEQQNGQEKVDGELIRGLMSMNYEGRKEMASFD